MLSFALGIDIQKKAAMNKDKQPEYLSFNQRLKRNLLIWLLVFAITGIILAGLTMISPFR